ncbi:putative metallophosphoesterase [Salvia divinorum]|uniref:Metallophosphoesterase n=1 Tax=Salvia divinorum TaxID=28513 RepID=A0ABD1FLW4_SALDI
MMWRKKKVGRWRKIRKEAGEDVEEEEGWQVEKDQDGKSNDKLTMRQDEEEWIEYQKVMQDVVERSGLDQRTFYDIRGNHDNFGASVTGRSLDFFSRYSINAQLHRSRKVNSITIQTSKRKVLFVGFDSTMYSGLRGLTNLFEHPTDELLAEVDSELLQWDSQYAHPVTKNASSCHDIDARTDVFWEWEMSDWRKSRAMRVLAIDRGHISFVDVNFTLGAEKTIILPTYPLDSHFSSMSNYKCDLSPYGHIRALVFSVSPIVSVEAKVYDTSSRNLIIVLDTPMKKLDGSRGDLYVAPWHIQAFEDPPLERYVLQIEATDFRVGRQPLNLGRSQ